MRGIHRTGAAVASRVYTLPSGPLIVVCGVGSQGLMLEATSERLMQPGGAHFNCPDKVRRVPRLETNPAACISRRTSFH
jgi:hypothetical protein